MPRKPQPPEQPSQRAIDLTNIDYGQFEVAARVWQVPPEAVFQVRRGDTERLDKVMLRWVSPPMPLPAPKTKRAADLEKGDKVLHDEHGWLVLFTRTIYVDEPTATIYWQALDNRLRPVVVGWLAGHEIAVYEEIR